jgi:WD40 repeat protein
MFIKLNNPLCTYRGHNSAVNAVTYASGGELIVSGSASGHIAVWEGSLSDKCIRRFGGRGGAILSLRVSDDGKIFSSSEDHSIRIWELSTGQELKAILNGHAAPINAIALTPDGKRIISVSDDATLRVFDADSGELSALPLHLPDRVFAVAVSRDGTLVACSGADLCVHVWRANIARRAVWPDSFIRKARGLEFCLVDEQGFLSDFSQPDDGWLRGSTNQPMFWIPSVYRMGLWTPRTVGILGALETIVDLRNFVHGTNWEQCTASVSAGKAT